MSVLPLYSMCQYSKLFPSESLLLTAEDDTLFLGDEVTIKENQIVKVLPAPILVQFWYRDLIFGIRWIQRFILGCVTGYQVIRVIRIFAKTYPFE